MTQLTLALAILPLSLSSIIRELLFRAKMIFLKGGDTGMIGKCESYQARVDLLKILLEANYPDLPTLNDLSKMDTAR